MDWWQALVLGIVEGVTEYLPVSSTGHLILAQRLMHIPAGAAADAYAICIQAGAIAAVLGLYWPRVSQMALGVLGRSPKGLALAANIVVAFLPAAVFGVLLDDLIERYLFGLWPITAAWLAGGLAILAVARWRPRRPAEAETGQDLDSLAWPMALAIGCAQCLAMWPGTSRSLVTILAGMLAGLSVAGAVEFSFLLGVVTLTAATVFKAAHSGLAMIQAYGWPSMLIGFSAAALSAAAAVHWLVSYLKRHSLSIFGLYRLGLAAAVALALFGGLLP
ncbi:MAG: undecaprenyl-diphosphate phosphatase [Thermodesulfobacteriota bacterium]